MTSVMGPAAVNEEKFTAWSTQQQVLGLLFDTRADTVAMPSAKIAKVRTLVDHAFHSASLSRSLLGSLRHVATCIRPAKAFVQRLRTGEIGPHRHVRVKVSDTMRADLVWWWRILADPSLNGVPLDYFGVPPEPDFMFATDASDEESCALVLALRLELTYQFTLEERALIDDFHVGDANEFDINYRELLVCALAVHAWASTWKQARTQPRPLHIHFRVDNTSAVAWQTKMSSRNSRAQVLILLLSLWEQSFGLRFSASHIRGVDNTAADAGSRRWSSDRLSNLFAELTRGWTTTAVPGSIGEIENIWHSISANTRSQIPPSPDTPGLSNTGNNGRPAAG